MLRGFLTSNTGTTLFWKINQHSGWFGSVVCSRLVLKLDIMKITNQKKETIARFEEMGIDFDQDFHKYSFRFGTELTEAAKECGYRQPKNANGSLARYFFYHLQKIKNK